MKEENFFDKINNFIRDTEGSIVNALTAVAPWLAPLAPAAMSWAHMVNSLAFDKIIAGAIAFVVEVMGMASVSTIISFWSHNRKYRDDKLKAPVGIAIGTFLFYLAVILSMNVLLDAASVPSWTVDKDTSLIAARAMLTLLTVPAAILLAIRTQHNELLDGLEMAKAARREQRGQSTRGQNQTSSVPTREEKLERLKYRRAKFFDDARSGRLQQELQSRGLSFSADTVAEIYRVTPRTGWTWIDAFKKEQNGG